MGTWISIGHTAVAEVAALQEVDFALIDLEHTTISYETVQNMVFAIESTDGPTEPLLRVPENDPIPIKRSLDTGASAVMVPFVETGEGARSAVAATRYPPEGIRGIAGSRAAGYGLEFEEYVQNSNENVFTVVQIETERAVSNADEIAGVEGVDAIFVGPADLSGNLGVFTEWESETFFEAVEQVLADAHEHDVPVGTLAVGEENMHRQVEYGYDYMIAGKDASHLASGIETMKEKYAEAMRER